MARERPEKGIKHEFQSAKLGDLRLNRRLEGIAAAIEKNPSEAFPRAMKGTAELEGLYRFLGNPKVSAEAILKPHVDASLERMVGRDVLVVHDTTEFRYGGKREGLGRLNISGHGYLGHFSLAVSADGLREPLGVLNVETWARRQPSATARLKAGEIHVGQRAMMETEQSRWVRCIGKVRALLPSADAVVHVMDSESDSYRLLTTLTIENDRFVLRAKKDRLMTDGQHVLERMHTTSVVARRMVSLSRRRRQPGGGGRRTEVRDEREAELGISAARVEIQHPGYYRAEPSSLWVNVVAVRELNVPPDCEPVEWILVTNEPIGTVEEILRVVDAYRYRWVIEEYFKALKTGCNVEGRQLESWDTLVNALAVFIPIAWSLLRFRTLSRTDEKISATAVMTEVQIEILRRESGIALPAKPSIQEALLAVARLGGHLKSNGPPGWQVLGRGYLELLQLTRGFNLAREM